MPTIEPGSTILVSGANGFIAAHCIRRLLSAGVHVVGTVRSISKASSVLATHNHSVCLEIVEVSDLCSESQWSEALKGCDAVMHLASTFRYDVPPGQFESQLLRPAVDGTVAILVAAEKERAVKRVMIMSSFAAVNDASKGPQLGKVYTEADWCPITWEEGAKATGVPVAYRASKALSERAAWEFMEKQNPSFGLVTLCPGMVFGPLLQPINALRDLNASNQIIWDVVSGQSKDIPRTKAPIFTDVTDIAEVSLRSLIVPDAAGRRYLIASGSYDTQEIADTVRVVFPEKRDVILVGETGKRFASTHYSIDNSKAEKELGMEFSDLEASIVPLFRQLYHMQEGENATSEKVVQQSVL